jgi:dimethylamine/trimethylamine dehydrogenase
MIELGVAIEANTALQAVAEDHVTLACTFTGRERKIEASSTILVTAKNVDDALYHALPMGTATRIGDCYSPGTIAAAVHAGRKFAEGFGDPEPDFLSLPYRREVTELSP